MIDIVKFISDKCEVLDYSFVLSKTENVNADLIGIDFRDGRNVLYMTLPTVKRKKEGIFYSQDVDFVFDLLLCRKFENESFSSVAENTVQKYDNRLHELLELLDTFIVGLSVSCSDKVILENSAIVTFTNAFSVSIDGVSSTITASAWGQ
jgi:hypothetical protein